EVPLLHSCEFREAGDLLQSGRAWVPVAGLARPPEGVGVRVDDDMTRGAGDEPPSVVDYRATRADEVDGAVRLLVRLGGVLLPVENLERPCAAQQERHAAGDAG